MIRALTWVHHKDQQWSTTQSSTMSHLRKERKKNKSKLLTSLKWMLESLIFRGARRKCQKWTSHIMKLNYLTTNTWLMAHRMIGYFEKPWKRDRNCAKYLNKHWQRASKLSKYKMISRSMTTKAINFITILLILVS